MTGALFSLSFTQAREIDRSEPRQGEAIFIPSPIEFPNENLIESVLVVPP